MPQGGTLNIHGYVRANRVLLEVSDTGIGVPDGVPIFDAFATTKPNGTGLGLPIVKKIISAHGGTVAYRNQPGQGTVFTLSLPALR